MPDRHGEKASLDGPDYARETSFSPVKPVRSGVKQNIAYMVQFLLASFNFREVFRESTENSNLNRKKNFPTRDVTDIFADTEAESEQRYVTFNPSKLDCRYNSRFIVSNVLLYTCIMPR